MTATCPVCQAPQAEGLLCHDDTSRLERQLSEVRSLVDELATTISKQARIGTAGKPGPAHERSPLNFGAVEAADNLANVLTTWARDVGGISAASAEKSPPLVAAWVLLSRIPAIRWHLAVTALVDEIGDAITQARRAIDRPQDRIYVGPCWVETPDEEGRQVTCLEDLYAKPGAPEVACKTCGATQDVADRRSILLEHAADYIVSVREASQYVGYFGGISVNQKTIRTWIDRDKLPTRPIARRPGQPEERHIRLGDLFIILAEKAGKTRRAAA